MPYVEHLMGVALLLDRAGFDETVVIAGLLHDAVEDVEGITLEQVEADFGPEVARIVGDCTERKNDPTGKRRPWVERKSEHLDHLEKAPIASRAVALADKLHNLTSVLADLEDGREVWSIFNAPREQIVWYYRAALTRYRADDPRLESLAEEGLRALERIESAFEENAEAR